MKSVTRCKKFGTRVPLITPLVHTEQLLLSGLTKHYYELRTGHNIHYIVITESCMVLHKREISKDS